MSMHRPTWTIRVVALAAALGVSVMPIAAQAGGQQGQGQAQSGARQTGGDGPPSASSAVGSIDLEKFRKELEQDPVLDLTQTGLRFYSTVIANPFSPERVLGDNTTQLLYGPTRGGAAMTHDEFLAMVTPKELYSSGGIQAHEMLEWSIVNLVGQALVKKALEAFRNARTEAEVQSIRDQIDRELEMLRRARQGDGGGT